MSRRKLTLGFDPDELAAIRERRKLDREETKPEERNPILGLIGDYGEEGVPDQQTTENNELGYPCSENGDWKAVIDQTSGKTYFWHLKTRKVVWVLPPGEYVKLEKPKSYALPPAKQTEINRDHESKVVSPNTHSAAANDSGSIEQLERIASEQEIGQETTPQKTQKSKFDVSASSLGLSSSSAEQISSDQPSEAILESASAGQTLQATAHQETEQALGDKGQPDKRKREPVISEEQLAEEMVGQFLQKTWKRLIENKNCPDALLTYKEEEEKKLKLKWKNEQIKKEHLLIEGAQSSIFELNQGIEAVLYEIDFVYNIVSLWSNSIDEPTKTASQEYKAKLDSARQSVQNLWAELQFRAKDFTKGGIKPEYMLEKLSVAREQIQGVATEIQSLKETILSAPSPELLHNVIQTNATTRNAPGFKKRKPSKKIKRGPDKLLQNLMQKWKTSEQTYTEYEKEESDEDDMEIRLRQWYQNQIKTGNKNNPNFIPLPTSRS